MTYAQVGIRIYTIPMSFSGGNFGSRITTNARCATSVKPHCSYYWSVLWYTGEELPIAQIIPGLGIPIDPAYEVYYDTTSCKIASTWLAIFRLSSTGTFFQSMTSCGNDAGIYYSNIFTAVSVSGVNCLDWTSNSPAEASLLGANADNFIGTDDPFFSPCDTLARAVCACMPAPTASPTQFPTQPPSKSPSRTPSNAPTTPAPSRAPTVSQPTRSPSQSPSTSTPSASPTARIVCPAEPYNNTFLPGFYYS